jgi:hypothetical protein
MGEGRSLVNGHGEALPAVGKAVLTAVDTEGFQRLFHKNAPFQGFLLIIAPEGQDVKSSEN